jgi:hypothetical protein
MQMNNIFNKLNLRNYFFDQKLNIKTDFICYLYDNLEKENYETLRWDLKIALTNNGNGEYI